MPRAYLVAGMGFGDEGKGTIVDTLVRHTGATLVVRYNGGAQAAHHVHAPMGTHCFSQFGAGTLAGARTFLSENVIVDPPALYREAQHLESLGVAEPYTRLEIAPGAPIVTPWHRALNQLREVARGHGKHGSCGRGMGEVVREIFDGRDYIGAGELHNIRTLFPKAQKVRDRLLQDARAADLLNINHWALGTLERSAVDWVQDIERVTRLWRCREQPTWPEGPVVFEGAQGALLDQWNGFHPYTTWSNTTFQWAEDIVKRAFIRYEPVRVGVIRSYVTRHGAGPLPTETITMQSIVRDDANSRNDWQGELRVGAFDFMLLHYAQEMVGGVDTWAVTHLDKVTDRWAVATAYRAGAALYTELPATPGAQDLRTAESRTDILRNVQPVYEHLDSPYALLKKIEDDTATKVGICSWGPTGSPQHKTITDACPCRQDVKSLFAVS